MSLKTKLLELFKYEPDKDGAQTFNIKSALNDNWDKIEAWAQSVKTALAKLVPTSRTVNGKALTKDVTLTGDDIAMGADDAENLRTAMANDPWRRKRLRCQAILTQKVIFRAVKAWYSAQQTQIGTETCRLNTPRMPNCVLRCLAATMCGLALQIAVFGLHVQEMMLSRHAISGMSLHGALRQRCMNCLWLMAGRHTAKVCAGTLVTSSRR